MSETKVCSQCKQEKDISKYNFYHTRGYHRAECKDCLSNQRKEYYSKNKNQILKHNRNNKMMREYGLNIESYENMKALAGDTCPICKTKSNKMVLDHCHKTGKLRGFICDKCNVGLGRFNDSIQELQSAINYLTGSLQ